MIEKINEKCPGDCAKCEIAQSLPNFDYSFCMSYQIFKGVQRMSNEIAQIKRVIGEDKMKAIVESESSQLYNNEKE